MGGIPKWRLYVVRPPSRRAFAACYARPEYTTPILLLLGSFLLLSWLEQFFQSVKFFGENIAASLEISDQAA